MARPARFFLPDQPLHVIQRGNNRQAIFFRDDDYARCRDWLAAAASEHGLTIHAYVFMTNHVHLLVTPNSAVSLPRTMQSLGRRYVRHLNTSYQRTGTLWEGRYRAAPIESEAHFLACCRYIELNPVRAGMTAHPVDHPWSSYGAHAHGASDMLVKHHPLYQALGDTAASRQATYRELFRTPLDSGFIDELRAATNSGWALGSERFKREIARALGRRVEPLPKGRRPKDRDDEGQTRLF